jgi:hypothetical protein
MKLMMFDYFFMSLGTNNFFFFYPSVNLKAWKIFNVHFSKQRGGRLWPTPFVYTSISVCLLDLKIIIVKELKIKLEKEMIIFSQVLSYFLNQASIYPAQANRSKCKCIHVHI